MNTYPKKVAIIREILEADSYVNMLLSLYGNYVIQKALGEAQEPEHSLLVKVLLLDNRCTLRK